MNSSTTIEPFGATLTIGRMSSATPASSCTQLVLLMPADMTTTFGPHGLERLLGELDRRLCGVVLVRHAASVERRGRAVLDALVVAVEHLPRAVTRDREVLVVRVAV